MGRDDEWPETESIAPGGSSGPNPDAFFARRYRIEHEIGRGGFGAVYRAVERDIDRPVALKILRANRPGAIERARFRREGELAKRLSHPNTVRLFDLGEDESGTPFIAYELLEGHSLATVLRAEGPLAPARAARIAAQMLKSLMEAHEHSIVHRDIKPGNVFLCDFAGEREFVKLLDFGIARQVTNAVTELTQDGTVVGTPRYMAPEQLRGDPPHPAMDIYAVGMTLAEMIEGRPLYRGTAMEVCLAVTSDHEVPVGERSLASPLGIVIARALAKDPRARFASAREMLEALERPAAPPPTTAPPKRWPLVLGGAIAAIALFGLLGAVALGSLAIFGSPQVLPEASGKPRWIDADAIAARLRERGYGDVKLERSDKEIEIVASRADRQATVLRMNGKSAAAAELLESIHAKQGYAIARHESALCAVRVQRVGAGTDPAASRALLAELF